MVADKCKHLNLVKTTLFKLHFTFKNSSSLPRCCTNLCAGAWCPRLHHWSANSCRACTITCLRLCHSCQHFILIWLLYATSDFDRWDILSAAGAKLFWNIRTERGAWLNPCLCSVSCCLIQILRNFTQSQENIPSRRQDRGELSDCVLFYLLQLKKSCV